MLRELDVYADEQIEFEAEEEIISNNGWLSSKELIAVLNIFRQVFEGKDVITDLSYGEYTDAFLKLIFSDTEICLEGYDDVPCNGYDPHIKTNMLDMSEEKDYYIYLDDMFGQEASSELYIDLKKTELV